MEILQIIEMVCGSSIMQFLAIITLVYSLLIFVIMELVIDSKGPDGILRLKKDGFIILFLFKGNLLRNEGYKQYPNNICQLYWGLWISSGCSLVFLIIAAVMVGLILAVLFLCGFLPHSGNGLVGPYERYGKNNEKRWIAPWKMILPLGVAYLLLSHRDKLMFIVKTIGYQIGQKWQFVSNPLTIKIIGGFVLGIVVFIIIKKIIRRIPISAAWLFLKSLKDGACVRVEMVD